MTTPAYTPGARRSGGEGGRLDVLAFLGGNYTPEELEPSFRPAPPRMDILFETVERVRRERGEGG